MLFVSGPKDGDAGVVKNNRVSVTDMVYGSPDEEPSGQTTIYTSRTLSLGHDASVVIMAPEGAKNHELLQRIIAVYFHQSAEVPEES